MPFNRFYTTEDLGSETIKLDEVEFHHLKNVMRCHEGDQVEIVNGKGALAIAEISKIDKRDATLLIKEYKTEDLSPVKMILALALPRPNRLDFILEKGTELGMTELWLFPGMQSERKEANLERMNSVLISALKQCGRLFLPEIKMMPPLLKWDSIPKNAFFGDVSKEAPPFKCPKEGAIFFIGPESGFTDQEVDKLKSLGAHGVSLHPNILRTDTAALTALVKMSLE